MRIRISVKFKDGRELPVKDTDVDIYEDFGVREDIACVRFTCFESPTVHMPDIMLYPEPGDKLIHYRKLRDVAPMDRVWFTVVGWERDGVVTACMINEGMGYVIPVTKRVPGDGN